MRARWCCAVMLALLATRQSPVGADDGLEAARRLYAAAAYEDALKTLEGLGAGNTDPGASIAVEQQRVLCLVALGRPADAEQAMTAIVQADPLYFPTRRVRRPGCGRLPRRAREARPCPREERVRARPRGV